MMGGAAERHIEQFGVKQMHVPTVTSSAKRVQNMVENVRAITEGKGSNFFLFIDQETLAASNPLAAMWTLKTPTKLSMCTLLGADHFGAYHCNHRIRGPDIPPRGHQRTLSRYPHWNCWSGN